MLDPVKVEAAEASIDRFILQRSASKDKANLLAQEWAASERRHREKLRQEHRWQWIRYSECLADSHARIADENRAKAEALLEEAGEGVVVSGCLPRYQAGWR